MWRQGAWRAPRLLLEQLTLSEGAGERIVSHSAASSSSSSSHHATASLLLLPARGFHAGARLAVLPGTGAHGALFQQLRLAADSGARWQVCVVFVVCGRMAIASVSCCVGESERAAARLFSCCC